MSGPYRFQGESAKSPLERSSSPFSAGQPVSFKTNVNRAKTKKWVTAKKNAYDGDDWGGYDEYDEYGVEDEPAPAPAPSQQRYYAGGQPQRQYTDRSFTEPIQPGAPGSARRNSFEAGEEHRAFSASIPPPQQGGYAQPQHGERQRQTSGTSSDMGHEPQGRRDFTPSAMPPPLQTQVSPMPSDINSSPARAQFPPRKSSISQTDAPVATSPRPRTGSHSDKPLPFVRPSDIYKRVEEERERERASLDSSRPSLDSLSSRPKDDLHSPTSDGGRHLQPLETVAERKSEYLPDFDAAFTRDKQPAASAQSQASASAVSPPSDQGFRSVVDQAFTRSDEQRSIPPTPISKDDDSSMSRTNTSSSTGISPIMSRVPSGATSAIKRTHVGGEGSTPAIEEEPNDTATFVPGATSTFAHDPSHAAAPNPAAGHSRNISASSIPRSGLATPTRGDSPARSPVVSPLKALPEPKAAQITTGSPDEPRAMEGGLSGPLPAYAAREADLASAAKSSPVNESHGLGLAEQRAQDAYLDSHAEQSPIEDALPRSRSESPSKGRVQALAGRFGDVSHSRRGSTQSNISRNSMQSWEKSQHSSRAPSPTKGSPSKPSSPVKEFRPHLPGQWESYATTVATPLDQGERDRSLGSEQDKVPGSLEGADLTPTTAKHPVDEIKSDDGIDPIVALKNAGAAMAQSFKTTVGMDDASSEPNDKPAGNAKGPSYGDMYMPRPLQLERTVSSLSTIPPTPPAKDTPRSEEPPQLPSKDSDASTPVQNKRPDFFPQLSTQPSADDQESDRLRKEIVASLTPVASADPLRSSLQPASPGANRASSILPAEYDSYWADGDNGISPQPSQEIGHSTPPSSSAAVAPVVIQTEEPLKPSMLNRFSWENNAPQLAVLDSVAEASAVPEPTKASNEESISRSTESAVEERQQLPEDLSDPYFGPGHTITITKPEPMTELEPSARSPAVPVDSTSLASTTREHNGSPPGLHVVNSAVDPEAVDLPPRLSADVEAQKRQVEDDLKVLQREVDGERPNPAISAAVSVPEPQTPTHTTAQAPQALSPTSGKPLGTREIATIGTAAERIATYNQTREHWATQDHGLGSWLASTLEANPELVSQTIPVQRVPTGTVRHKHTASLSLLGKLGGASTHNLGNEQNPGTTAQAPIGAGSPTSGGRVASRQLEAKGKDLLHTANVLSGKGLTSAKGLFAKGKSRFGREKAPRSGTDSMPSSREASEEPEFTAAASRRSTSATTVTDKHMRQPTADIDSPWEERRKRRFSINSFRRSSRSRSRPNSIALPPIGPFPSSTPKGTPPREVSRILEDEKSWTHTFHAPDSWGVRPSQQQVKADEVLSTPPREQSQPQQSRLGILPSPAKSVFSAHDKDSEQIIPPVPLIPDTVRLSHDVSHEVLQSVIRYATPPIPTISEARALAKSPVLQHEVPEVGNREGPALPNVSRTQPQVEHDQWPLVSDFPPGASVSPSSIGQTSTRPALDSRPAHSSRFGPAISTKAPQNLKHTGQSDFDDDDQPPRLSYEPLPERSEPVELPAYLVPSHLDVSDDEGYNQADPSNTSLLTAPQAHGRELVSPLIQPTEPPLNAMSDHNRLISLARGSTCKHDDDNTGAGAQARVLPRGPPSAPASGSTNSRPEALGVQHTSLVGEPKATSTSRFQIAKTSLDAVTEARISSDASSVDQAISPAPVWYASELRPPKMRAQGATGSHTAAHKRLGGEGEENTVVGSQAEVEEVQGMLPAPDTVGSADGTTHEPHAWRGAVHVARAARAVQENGASNSSFASWDRDSASANSVSGSRQTSEMRNESELVTPIAPVPKIVQHAQADEAERSNNNARHVAAPNGYFEGHEIPSHTIRLPQQQSSELTVPERSKSMLSMISSMVSEGGTPVSPASSNAGRSTPSTIRRMYHDSAGKNPSTSDRIPEESSTTNGDHTPTGTDDDFDLYADPRDERIQPVKPEEPAAGGLKEAHREDGRRYSTERPMSFISGPTDQDGRPQDQLNQPLKQGNLPTRSIAEQGSMQNQQPSHVSNSAVYSTMSPDSVLQQSNMFSTPQLGSQEHPRTQVPAAQTSDPREQSGSTLSQPQLANGHASQPSQMVNHGVQGPHIYGGPGQSMPQQTGMSGQITAPQHGYHLARQQPGSLPTPRSEYELQQQRMQLQGQYHQQGGAGAGLYGGPQVSAQQPSKQQEKSSSMPKLSAVFKNLGGKLQGNHANAPNAAVTHNQHQAAIDPNRNASYHSGVSSLHPEQPRLGNQAVSSASPNRPPSNGAESHFSHGSQGSTHAQPTHSRVDLRKPASPMPVQGIPPQILPHGPPKHNTQPPSHQTHVSGGPETGKKKRFSSLGNMFSRVNEPKLSKEQKKAQKAQRQSAPLQMQGAPTQWPPLQPQFRPQQNGMPYTPGQYPPGHYPPQQMQTIGPQFAPAQTMSPASLQGAQGMDPYGPSQHYQQAQPRLPSQQPPQAIPSDQGSAYLSTRQLAEQHKALQVLTAVGQTMGPKSPPTTQPTSLPIGHHAQQPQQPNYGPPPGGYYNTKQPRIVPDQGVAFNANQIPRQAVDQLRQNDSPSQGTDGIPPTDRRQPSAQEIEAYRALHAERLRLEQIRLQLESERRGINGPTAEQAQYQHGRPEPRKDSSSASMAQRQQPQQDQVSGLRSDHLHPDKARQHDDSMNGNVDASNDDLRRHQEREQIEEQLRSRPNPETEPPAFNQRAVSGPLPNHSVQNQVPTTQRHVSTPIEPQYETPQIPAAYSHVSGAFISPIDREQSRFVASAQSEIQPEQYHRQYSDPRMPTISPQVSAQSQMPPNNRTHSDASTVSVVSPIGAPAQSVPIVPSLPDQRTHKSRMSSISEVQGTSERPWHLDVPEGATEQEIVRARQKQFMQQQFTVREQQHAERVKQSPSPRASPHSPSFSQPLMQKSVPQQQDGGYRELLPRTSPQPYQQHQSPRDMDQDKSGGSPQLPLLASLRSEQPHQPAAYPLPMSPDANRSMSSANPLENLLPAPPLSLPKSPHSPMHPRTMASHPSPSPGQQDTGVNREQYEPSLPQDEHYSQPPHEESSYERSLVDEPPPSYDGPGVPNDGLNKSRPEQPRPPNIATNVDLNPRGRQDEYRSRQASIGILQHPQPASMAASPQRSEADMGAESLRRQLLQQEEHARMERIQRAQIQRAESEREKQEREAARARARELERSVSGGAAVGSIRSVGGSRNGGQPGWERRGSSNRQVFELPAVEDDEPAMRATSYPGQEWVPQYWTDD
ncbi:hypothetical protein HBI23_027540 [Parastagonospora nodorum]|nr:hypothetical protein HBI79_011520 [Parastagonospora nodorum]KAH5337619.1 hypothetical protein HBI12_021270 [Parastagonospora nodorum]KAH5446835.1 hypothetical protein HBI47_018440 [Parastagonospora nodorum]KAH5689077.1 hypothetical protein HBI23_027540 [Parastagonospora nodorum]KAH6065411.1 hypothetical protein HBI67_127610 [Parastagonospora nodorum]